MKPRGYQSDAVNAIWQYFADGNEGNPIVAMPTGTGKSIVIGDFIKQVCQQYPGQRIMMLTHVQELIEQNFEKLLILWPTAPAGIYSAGLGRRDTIQPIIFGGIGSVNKKLDQFQPPDLILIDECHLVSPNANTMYRAFIDSVKEVNRYVKVIGFTATKYRLGLGYLTDGGLFTDVCYDITGMEPFNRLIAEGYLAPLVPKRTAAKVDGEGVKIRGGEFIQKDLQVAVDKDEITYAAVKELIEYGADRDHWLIFGTGVEHCEHIVEMLHTFDISAAAVHSEVGKTERAERLAAFEIGKLRALVNNNVLTTGYDFPGIDLIGVFRPTSSAALWVQMLGRGTRPVYAEGFDLSTQSGRLAAIEAGPKQNCLVLDFAANTKRLGPINDPVLPKKKGKGGGDAPIRECEVCNTYCHASLRFCPECGEEFPREIKIFAHAGKDALLADGLPVISICDVDKIIYTKHKKMGRPDSIRVTYYCGLHHYNEFVCLEHEGFAHRKAIEWWSERCPGEEPPRSTEEALAVAGTLPTPTHIRVWTNKKYPEVMAYDYSGRAFN